MEKVDLSLTLSSNPPSEDYLEMIHRVINDDTSIQKIFVLPNWNYDFLMPPTGMIVEFDANALFKADLFFTDMWNATSLVRVEAVDEEALDGCQDAVYLATPRSVQDSPRFENSDAFNWNPSIGDRNTSVGLYSANRQNPKTQMIERAWFVIAKTGLDSKTYSEMESYFLRCEEDKKTHKDVFFNNPIIEQFQALVVRNRRRVVHDFAEAAGITIRSRKYSKGTKPMGIANEEFITMNNYVKFNASESQMLFYADATSTDDVHHGLIFHRAPLQAPLIYVGPVARRGTALFNGNKWGNSSYNAFPTSVGKHEEPATWKQFSRIGLSEASLAQKLILDGTPKNHSELLRYFPYHERSQEYRDMEEKMGYTFNNVIPVNPHLIRFV